MALLLTVAGAAASCPAVSCTSCVDTAFGHRIDDLFVEVYPNDASVCASDHVNLNFGVDYVTKNNLGGEAAAQPPKAAVLLFLQRVLPGLALPPRLECSALARLARLLCLASARSALS